LIHTVALARLRIKSNVVRQTGAAATLDAKTQSALLGRNAFFGHRGADTADSLLRNLHAFDFAARGRRRLWSLGGRSGWRDGCELRHRFLYQLRAAYLRFLKGVQHREIAPIIINEE
jgi:hypothetical protein